MSMQEMLIPYWHCYISLAWVLLLSQPFAVVLKEVQCFQLRNQSCLAIRN